MFEFDGFNFLDVNVVYLIFGVLFVSVCFFVLLFELKNVLFFVKYF